MWLFYDDEPICGNQLERATLKFNFKCNIWTFCLLNGEIIHDPVQLSTCHLDEVIQIVRKKFSPPIPKLSPLRFHLNAEKGVLISRNGPEGVQNLFKYLIFPHD